MKALEDIPIKAEIYDSYRERSNTRFFLNYGFVLEPNDINDAVLNLLLTADSPHHEIKSELLDKL